MHHTKITKLFIHLCHDDDKTITKCRELDVDSKQAKIKYNVIRSYLFIQSQVILMHYNLTSSFVFQFLSTRNVIQVTMRNQDALERQTLSGDSFQDFIDVTTWIDNDAFTSLWIPDDGAIALQRRNRKGFDYRSGNRHLFFGSMDVRSCNAFPEDEAGLNDPDETAWTFLYSKSNLCSCTSDFSSVAGITHHGGGRTLAFAPIAI
jgi:hypothetical protein